MTPTLCSPTISLNVVSGIHNTGRKLKQETESI